jgi:hypothetical protein
LLLLLSCRLFFFLRGLTRFSFSRLCCSLCAGRGFSYPWSLRFPLLNSPALLLSSRLACPAKLWTSSANARSASLGALLCLALLNSLSFALNSLFSRLEALDLRTLFCPLWALFFLSIEAGLPAPCLLERLTRSHASLTCYSLRGTRSAPLSRSSGFARGRCAALLSDRLSWFFGMTTLCLWRSCQTLCWVTRTGARSPRRSWLTS